MDNYKIYWIWLQQVLKYGSNKISAINKFYKSAKDFYLAGENDWRLCGIFNYKEIQDMCKLKISDVKNIYDKCNALGYSVVTYEDVEYPQKLKNIQNPPCVLYVSGNLKSLNDKFCVSIVGTRNATMYGLNTAFEISHDLAEFGVTVVSGGAMGIDTAAHKGTIQGNGKTIAVLACGINYDYLKTNASLRSIIERKGALVSEYPPDYPVHASNFIIRNRIISGLSICTIVIEAGERSGSLITANLALEQNRDVFVALPIDISESVSKGALSLIGDGAKVVTNAEEIVKEYQISSDEQNFKSKFKVRKIKSDLINQAVSNKEEEQVKEISNKEVLNTKKLDESKKKLLANLSGGARKIYDLLENKKYHIDEISILSNMSIKELLPAITELEILNLLKSYSGRMYEKI